MLGIWRTKLYTFLFNDMISFSICSLVVSSVIVNDHHHENKSAMEVMFKNSSLIASMWFTLDVNCEKLHS
jgi:hypothetical protein